MRTVGSLWERPRDTRQPLPSSDAAMGPARRAEGPRDQRIRGGQGHDEGLRGSFFKKGEEKGTGEGKEPEEEEARASFKANRQ